MCGKPIILYTKYCFSCQHPDEYNAIICYVLHEDIKLKAKRTAYRPEWHKKASALWGSEDYDAFIVINGKVIDAMEFAKQCKNKLAPQGKEKDNDVLRLPKAKRSNRKNKLVAPVSKTEAANTQEHERSELEI